MKLIVCTASTQGDRASDFFWATEGELAMFPAVCDRDNKPGADPDGGCGCGRAFAGVESSKSTTTALVVDRPDISAEHLFLLIRRALDDGGWTELIGDDEANAWTHEQVQNIANIGDTFPAGAVVELRSGFVGCRGAWITPAAGGPGGGPAAAGAGGEPGAG